MELTYLVSLSAGDDQKAIQTYELALVIECEVSGMRCSCTATVQSAEAFLPCCKEGSMLLLLWLVNLSDYSAVMRVPDAVPFTWRVNTHRIAIQEAQ